MGLFTRYDKIVQLPGGGLQSSDFRMRSMMMDIELAAELGIPYAIGATSICPLVDVDVLRKVSLLQAREPRTAKWLREQRLAHFETVDVAWADSILETSRVERTLLMLRWDGELKVDDVERSSSGILTIQRRSFELQGELVVSTSDSLKDSALGVNLAKKLSCKWLPCQSLDELKTMIASSSGVITDRYHPTIIAHMSNVPCCFIGSKSVRNEGLRLLLDLPVHELNRRSREGLAVLTGWCQQ